VSDLRINARPLLIGSVPCALVLLAVNLVIVAKLFGVEYSAYTGSIEGTFIAIPRIMAKYPGQWSWWPFWNGGMPFENVYLPFTHWLVAAFILLTRMSAARSFHIVTAAVYALSAPALFWMAFALSRRLVTSFVAALAYSCLSPSALLVRAVAVDIGGPWNLRRLYNLVFYGESPHSIALGLLPVAVVCFSRALTTNTAKWKIAAGVAAACVVLSNAFGIVTLVLALICWLLAFRSEPRWRAPLTVFAIGIVTYCWVAPWLSPSMIRAIRANAPTTGGDYRYTPATWPALGITAAGFVLLWSVLRWSKTPAHLRFFTLFAYIPAGLLLAWYVWKIPLIAQPARYEMEMDMTLTLAVVFLGGAIVDRLPRRARTAVAAVVIGGLCVQVVHSVFFACNLIRSAEPRRLSEYKVAKWLDENRSGERAFVSGSASFLYNAFTDNPQLEGGHNQHTVNTFLPIVGFTVYSGMNAGDRDAEYSIFWLKAFGAHLISVPGPGSTDFYKPFAHPRKFDGVLPLLWRDGDDSIYEVPSRSSSLAHVIPASAVVTRTPIHGLDIAPVEPYVAALEDPRFPLATFQWRGLSEAVIHASLAPGQVIAVQITYERGWRAYVNGKPQSVRGDAIGQMVVAPDCIGPCEISLRYAGGGERTVTRTLSLCAMLVAACVWLVGRRQTPNRPQVSSSL